MIDQEKKDAIINQIITHYSGMDPAQTETFGLTKKSGHFIHYLRCTIKQLDEYPGMVTQNNILTQVCETHDIRHKEVVDLIREHIIMVEIVR